MFVSWRKGSQRSFENLLIHMLEVMKHRHIFGRAGVLGPHAPSLCRVSSPFYFFLLFLLFSFFWVLFVFH